MVASRRISRAPLDGPAIKAADKIALRPQPQAPADRGTGPSWEGVACGRAAPKKAPVRVTKSWPDQASLIGLTGLTETSTMNDQTNTAPLDDDADLLLVTITELAALKGVTKQTASERVAGFEAKHGLRTRRGRGGTKLVPLAEYDQLAGEISDLAKLQAAATMRIRREEAEDDGAGAESGFSLTDVQRRKLSYEASLKALEYGRQSGQLVAVTDVKRVVERIVEASRGAVDALVSRADELTTAANRDGVVGVRAVLKDEAFKLATKIAAAWRDLETVGKAEDAGGVEVDLDTSEETSP